MRNDYKAMGCLNGGTILRYAHAAIGVSEPRQQIRIARRYFWGVQAMYESGEYAAALSIAEDMFGLTEWKHAERRTIADVLLLAAQLYWRQKRLGKSIVAAGHAVVTRPLILGRPLKRLVQWLWRQGLARKQVYLPHRQRDLGQASIELPIRYAKIVPYSEGL